MTSLKRIGKYDVVEMIGRGGMGVVFKATDPMLGRPVAIKMMTGGFADDPDLLKRFYREAQSTASLNHPNIVTVYDMGDQDGNPYLVMQFLEGESLHAVIKSRRDLSLLTKMSYIIQICHGLQYAHQQQITHRDIKPANVMVLPNGTVKIVDFGIARIGNDGFTRPGQVMGSIHYMSPEQINEREVDARSDIFALAIVAYELLTFNLPFQGQDVPSTLLKILYDSPPPISAYLKLYPAEFDAILQRALAKNKEDRYQAVEELAFDLAQVEVQLRKEMIGKLHPENERLRALAPTVRPNPAALRPQQFRDQSVLELTPPGGIVRQGVTPPHGFTNNLNPSSSVSDGSDLNTITPLSTDSESRAPVTPGVTTTGTGSASSVDASGWQGDTLRTVEKQLASFIGSLARILVKNAASRTTNLEELYSILAASLAYEADREAFLARKVELSKSGTKSQLQREPVHDASSSALPNAAAPLELTAAAIDHAAHSLARYIGPIAGVLARRAAHRADNPRSLYMLLAEHIENKLERARFLRDLGVRES